MQDPRSMDYPAASYGWYAVAVLLLAYSVSFIDRQILSLMVQPIRADLHLTDTRVSLLQGLAFALLYTFLGIVLGRWADRYNRRRIVIAGMVAWCLATAACGIAANFSQLFVARIFVGIGEAALSPAAYSIISDTFPKERRGRPMSVYTMGIFIGSGLALIFGGLAVSAVSRAGLVTVPLLGAVASWRAVFLLVGLPGLAVAVLMLTVREPSRKEVTKRESTLADAFAFVRTSRAPLATVIFGNALLAVVNFSLSAWLPTYFIRLFGWTAGRIAAAYGVILLSAGCAGMVAGGWLADRLAARGRADAPMFVIRVSVLLLLPLIGWVGMVHSPAAALAFLIGSSFLLGMATGLFPNAVSTITPNQYRGQTFAIYLFATNFIGLGLGPTLVALSTDYLFRDDLAVGRSLALVTSVATVLCACCLLAGRRSYRAALPSLKG